MLRDHLGGFAADGRFPGVAAIIWQRGEVIACETIGWRDIARRLPLRRDTIFRLASMTKPITSTAAMILVEGAARSGAPDRGLVARGFGSQGAAYAGCHAR